LKIYELIVSPIEIQYAKDDRIIKSPFKPFVFERIRKYQRAIVTFSNPFENHKNKNDDGKH
jgi:hypothetical protein